MKTAYTFQEALIFYASATCPCNFPCDDIWLNDSQPFLIEDSALTTTLKTENVTPQW